MTLTKRERGIIRLASRKCGISYLAACSRGVGKKSDTVIELKRNGYLFMTDNGKNRGRFVFRATEKGLSEINKIGKVT